MPLYPAAVVAFDGQSLSLFPNTADAYPAKVMANYTASLGPVVARAATSWGLRADDAPGRVDAHLRSVTGPSLLVDNGGTFEVQAGFAAAAILAAADAYWSARTAAGWGLIVACTTVDSTFFTAPMQAERAAWNDLLRASSTPAGVADLAAAPELADASNATYFSDGLHFTAAGATVAAGVIQAALEAL